MCAWRLNFYILNLEKKLNFGLITYTKKELKLRKKLIKNLKTALAPQNGAKAMKLWPTPKIIKKKVKL